MTAEPVTVIRNARFVLPDAIRTGVALTVRGGRIAALSDAEVTERAEILDARDRYVIPGLVDIHVHGACGDTFNATSPLAWRQALQTHLAAGTTSVLATLASAPLEQLTGALAVARSLVAERLPGLLGVHLEGPYLAPEQRGAHAAEWLRSPADGSWRALLDHADVVRLVTLAPELEGAGDLIEALRRAQVVVSAGHSGITAAAMREARRRGVQHVAHLWSGQSMLTKRGPWRQLGLLEAALSSDDLTAELIADGCHAPAELTRIAYRCLGPERLCLVSDASCGTGLPVGSEFRMGGACGVVADGVALTHDGASFCGSTSYLADVLRFCVQGAAIPLVDAVRMASTTPARVLGLDAHVGRLVPELAADLLVLDHDLTILGVMKAGTWVQAPRALRG